MCLSSPILVKHEKTRHYAVNFDPHITELIREAEYMYKLDLRNSFLIIIRFFVSIGTFFY